MLAEVVDNKPEKNLWGIENVEISSRAFYRTGGWLNSVIPAKAEL